jgi:exonuclease SbcC
MLTFDYKIIRNEGDEEKCYVPKLDKNIPNLAAIEGPNSSGKSTLLHLIAAGCHGARNKRIHPMLRQKISELLESDHQQVKFVVKIDDGDGTLLEFEKPSSEKKDIKIYETSDDKRHLISPDEFQSRYALIYDIPDNPIGRVRELAMELSEEQNALTSQVGQFREFLRDTLEAISHAHDPKRIKELEELIADLEQEIESTENARAKLEDEHNQLKMYFGAKSAVESAEMIFELNRQLSMLRKDKRQKDKQVRQEFDEAEETGTETKRIFGLIEERVVEVVAFLKVLFPKEKRHFEYLESASWKTDLLDGDGNDKFGVLLTDFSNKIEEERDGNGNKSQVVEARFLEQLLETLLKFADSGVIVPVVNTGVKKFIDQIQKRFDECQQYADLARKLEKCAAGLKAIDHERNLFLMDVAPKLKKIRRPKAGGYSVIANPDSDDAHRRKTLEIRLENETQQYMHAKQICKDLKLPEENELPHFVATFEKIKEFRPYAAYNRSERENFLVKHSKRIIDSRGDIKVLQDRKNFKVQECENLKKRKPHQYQAEEPALKDLFAVVQRLEQRLRSQFRGYLDEVINGEITKNPPSDKSRYLQELWKYLGKRVQVIRHVDAEYDVTYIDLARGVIGTSKGKIIHLSDMGTGQGQAAYLKGVLNQDKNKKIIALLDEVAMMDKSSLAPIVESLKNLKKAGRLILGLIVQRGEQLKVSPL